MFQVRTFPNISYLCNIFVQWWIYKFLCLLNETIIFKIFMTFKHLPLIKYLPTKHENDSCTISVENKCKPIFKNMVPARHLPFVGLIYRQGVTSSGRSLWPFEWTSGLCPMPKYIMFFNHLEQKERTSILVVFWCRSSHLVRSWVTLLSKILSHY